MKAWPAWKEIDTVMKLRHGPPGQDHCSWQFIGLDVCYSVLKVLQDGFGNPKCAPCPLLTQYGHSRLSLGAKSGERFYKYTPGSKDLSSKPDVQK